MRLYMKQKVFSWGDKFTVVDERMDRVYQVEGEVFTIGKRLHVMDANGGELAFIRQKVWSFLTRFFVEVQGREVCEIVKEFSFFRPRYQISGALNWRVEGDLWAHEYEIVDGDGRCVMRMSKHWFTWGDSYEMDIDRIEDALACVCVALAIDAAMAVQAAANSGGYST